MFDNYYKCIPMYDSLQRQHNNLETVTTETRPVWECPGNWLLPFQVTRRKNPSTLAQLEIYTSAGVLYEVLNDIIKPFQLTIHSISMRDFIQFHASKELDEVIPCGQYYYKLTTAGRVWYSDIMTVFEKKNYTINTNIVVPGQGVLVRDPGTLWKPQPISGFMVANKIQ